MPRLMPGLVVLFLVIGDVRDTAAQAAEGSVLPIPRSEGAGGPVAIEGAADALRTAAGEDVALLFHVEPVGPATGVALVVRTAFEAIELSAIAMEAAMHLCTAPDARTTGKIADEPEPGASPGQRERAVPLPVLASEGLKDAMLDVRIIPLTGSGLPGAPETCTAPGPSCHVYRVEFWCAVEARAR